MTIAWYKSLRTLWDVSQRTHRDNIIIDLSNQLLLIFPLHRRFINFIHKRFDSYNPIIAVISKFVFFCNPMSSTDSNHRHLLDCLGRI